VVALALFVPLLIGTAGNTGAQAATTVVRAMAVGDVRFAELPRVVGRECLVGVLLGTSLAVVGFIPASLVAGNDIAIVLALALIVVCTLATTAGAFTPMIAKRIGLDPAVVSAPFITTFVDATGLVVYFLIARAVLGL
jgi:magnesium transporter